MIFPVETPFYGVYFYWKEVQYRMNKLSRIILVNGIALGMALSVSGCSVTAKKYEVGTPVKIGLICLHDTQSTYDKNFIDAMAEAAKELGARVDGEPIIKTGVDESNDCFDAAKDLVKQGCNVIFADSFGHEPFMLKAAKKWKEVTFCHATGTQAKVAGVENYHNAFASIYEGRYLAGYAAGLKLQRMVAANEIQAKNLDAQGNIKLGYIGAFPYAEVVSGYTSWYLGVKAVVPNVVMDVTYTSSWYSFDDEKAGASTLIERGAALISQHADSPGAPGECEAKGIPNVSYNLQLNAQCPNTYTAYSRINWAPYYEEVVNSMFEGRAIKGEVGNNYTGTLLTDSVQYDVVNAADKLICEDIKAELINGSRKVFDCANFTVKGEHLTSYQADVDDMGDFVPETNVIVTEGGKTFFNESALRSAPYFDIRIDGITELNNKQ